MPLPILFDETEILLQRIQKYCTNIETLDFTEKYIKMNHIENFKSLLKKCANLKSLRLKCGPYYCAIWHILCIEEFPMHDPKFKLHLRKLII